MIASNHNGDEYDWGDVPTWSDTNWDNNDQDDTGETPQPAGITYASSVQSGPTEIELQKAKVTLLTQFIEKTTGAKINTEYNIDNMAAIMIAQWKAGKKFHRHIAENNVIVNFSIETTN